MCARGNLGCAATELAQSREARPFEFPRASAHSSSCLAGPELQLHLPMAIECLQFDGRMQVLQQADCNETVT